MSQISTHVLDISLGRAAAGVPVVLEIEQAGVWKELSRVVTDRDGRAQNLVPSGSFEEGMYRLTFDTNAYFSKRRIEGMYPQVAVVFRVREAREHYHIPLLLSPYGYSTYRGS